MIKIGNAPCSWGVIENIEGDRSGYSKVLDEIVQTGYAGSELGDWGFMPTEPNELKAEFAKRNLELMGTWVNVYLNHEDRFQESLNNALRAAGQLALCGTKGSVINLGDEVYEIPERTINSGRITPAMGLSDKQWKSFGERANRLAETVMEKTGIRTLVHHHIGTWIETQAEIEALMANTDPNLVGLCFDTGHCYFGGGDPVEMLKKYASRVYHVHFKDCDDQVAADSRKFGWSGVESVGKGIFPELGKGSVDFKSVVNQLKEMNYSGWIIVEQDISPGMGTPKESAARNREYIKTLGL